MKIAIIGIRGIPFVYGGFESFAENLSVSLNRSNTYVTVYCRNKYFKEKPSAFKGVRRVILPSLPFQYFESISHGFLSTLHAISEKNTTILFFGLSNSILCCIPRIFGIRTIINVDGEDWKRAKWNLLGRIFLYLSARFVGILANTVITDSKYMQSYYSKYFHTKTIFIPYAIPKTIINNGETSKEIINLPPQSYYIWVGRIVPENNLHVLLNSFDKINTDKKCVIVGDDLYKTKYLNSILLNYKNKKYIYAGFLPREKYLVLLRDAYAYVETKCSGGTHPSLIEALIYSNLVVCYEHPSHRDVIGAAGIYYSDKIEPILSKTAKMTNSEYSSYKKKLKVRSTILNKWNRVLTMYKNLL